MIGNAIDGNKNKNLSTMDISDDPFLIILNLLTFEEYLKFRTTHKRVKEFDDHIEHKTKKIIIRNDWSEERVTKMEKKFKKVTFDTKRESSGNKIDISDDAFLMVLNHLTFEEYLRFRTTHERVKQFDSCIRHIKAINCDNSNSKKAKKIKRMTMKYLNVYFIVRLKNVRAKDDLSNFEYVDSLILSNTNVEDVSALKNVRNLNLSHTNVVDVSMLDFKHTLNLSYTRVEDVSMLGNVKKIIISRNNNIKNFGSVNASNIEYCD